jgi:adenylate cyclase
MQRRLRIFLNLYVLRGGISKLFHLVIVLGLVYLLTYPYFFDLNKTLLDQFSALRGFRLGNSRFELWYIWLTGGYCILAFNILYSIRSFKWHILSYIIGFSLLASVSSYFYYYSHQRFPLLQSAAVLLIEGEYHLFSKLSNILKEYDFLQKTFGKYVDESVLEGFIASPDSVGQLEGQKTITVLFSDIRNFTTISEKMEPNKLVAILNSYLDEMSKIVTVNHGIVDKFIGDAVMAFWNAPIENKNHATDAVFTAMQMVHRLNVLKAVNPAFSVFSIGVGVNTGKAIVGNIGGNRKYDYTVLGDNVNLGSRLEGLTKKYQIHVIVSQGVVKEFVQDPARPVIFRKIDTITVKGKSEPINIYQPFHKSAVTLKIKEVYEKGLQRYSTGDFAEAYKIWHDLSQQGDQVSQVMLHRIHKMDKTKPFNGVWNWDEK